MAKYVIRRVLQMFLVLVGATIILFATLFVIPGNPVGTIGGDKAKDPAVVKLLEHRYHLDEPLYKQYGYYVANLARGNLGEDFQQRRSVNEILAPKLVNTAELAFAAIGIEIIIGIAAGIIAAVFRYSFIDVFVTVGTTLTIGIPVFVIGLVLQQIFAQRLGILPLFGHSGFKSFIMPAVTLASVDAALVARLMRSSMLEVMRADYIRTAAAKGLTRTAVILKHALRNSIIPVTTYIGISFGTLLGGALITETIFNWDGIGAALIVAIQTQNNPIIMGVVTYGVLVFVVLNLVVDLLYAVLDPRIRLE